MSTTGSASDFRSGSSSSAREDRRPAFVTTQWSVVLAAGRSDSTHARDALARLCQLYWYPLYAHVRRLGRTAPDAQDLTQEFFARLLERRSFASADPARGRFRTFLLTAMNHFLNNEWEKARARKRGGLSPMLSLDLAAAEQRYGLEPADYSTPDKAFDKRWALTLLDEVLKKLEEEFRKEDKAELFLALKQTLTGSRETQPYADLAAQLNLSEGAVKVAVHRMRRRYREMIRAEIANTVASDEDVAGELRLLLLALSGT